MNKEQFNKEQDQLLKSILQARFFNGWKGISSVPPESSPAHESILELYITNKCNQNCTYCYLQKHKELYPPNVTEDQILNNLKILCDYIVANHFNIKQLDLFSGEIWHTEFGFQILDILYEYISNGMQIASILIPSNCYFVNNAQTFQRIQNYINKFQNTTSCQLLFSISVDGKIIDDIDRMRKNQEVYSEEFYDNLFTFAKINTFYFHPMINADTIQYWKENYEWWESKCKYYNMDINTMMLLEVRSTDWSDEATQEYCSFMNFLADKFYKDICHNDFELFANVIGDIRLNQNNTITLSGYIPWVVPQNRTAIGCTVSTALTIRLGDLAICPCHRTAYDKYIYGYFVVENNMITDIRANNPYVAIKILMSNTQVTSPICSTCLYNYCCLKGCYGLQLEQGADPFFPLEPLCKFFKTKIKSNLQYLRDKGIIDYYKSIDPHEYKYNTTIKFLLELDEKVKAEEETQNGMG